MKKIIQLLMIANLLLISSFAWAGSPGDPDVNLFINSNITFRHEVIGIQASTSFDAPIITSPVCVVGFSCHLQIEDCNGAIYACETDTENAVYNIVGDWNGISRQTNFEQDLNCTNNCRRNGAVEDTLATFNLSTVTRGSRWIRACWVDLGLKKCSPPKRIHTYEDVRNPPTGKSTCRPPPVGNFTITGRTCVFKHPDNNFTAIPLVVFVDKNLVTTQGGSFMLQGASIDFNLGSGGKGNHQIQLMANNPIPYAITQTELGYFDRNIPIFDRNMISFFGYSTN